MPDEVHQSFIRSFINYLKKQVGVMSPDQSESIEVAIQCLQAAFDVGDEEQEEVTNATQNTTSAAAAGGLPPGDAAAPSNTVNAPMNTMNMDVFELFQFLYVERHPETLELAQSIKSEGNRLMKDGKYNEALLQYDRAIAFDPKNAILYSNRAAAHIRLGDNERAVTDCKLALLYNVNYCKAYIRLGVAYMNLGKFDEADQAYAKAIELEPSNTDIRQKMEELRSARNQLPQLAELSNVLSGLVSSPVVRNMFAGADIDLQQLQSMSRNPDLMNTIRQLVTNTHAGGGLPGDAMPMTNEMMQVIRNIAGQYVPDQQGNNPGSGGPTGGQQPGNQPPPST